MLGVKTKLKAVKSKIPQKIETDELFDILFEMNRYFDKQFVSLLRKEKRVFNQCERNFLRKYYYYGINDVLKFGKLNSFKQYNANDKDKLNILNSFLDRCDKYDEEKIVTSIVERYKKLSNNKMVDNSTSWLKWYKSNRQSKFDFSLFIFDYSQSDFVNDNYDVTNILKIIADIYDHLENYRYFIFKLKGKLLNKNNEDVTWKVLYKIGVYCENFIQSNEKFMPFKQKKQVDELVDYLNQHFNSENIKYIAEDFYKNISYGFKFEDCLISENQENIILSYQKIKLDMSPIPCPACLSVIQNGNSFPELFMKSYECKNPNCTERSKSGRGKRFDEYSTYRYFKLVENNDENIISDELYEKWRKDIFDNRNNIYEMLIKYYAWDNEKICVLNKTGITNNYSRKILEYSPYGDSVYNYNFEDLPICKFFDQINKLLNHNTGKKRIRAHIKVLNVDSTIGIKELLPGQIGTVITSPPYYNAREYSQWKNLLIYLIDMMLNCNNVFDTLCKNGYYLYNIGDIVAADNVYVNSNMSKKRLQLGFLSCLIFEKIGFNVVGNIIWNKGEVQSKRSSTINHNTGYVKCINCYEHVLVFKKGHTKKIVSNVKKISPVIKINSKGENIYKHTAPYPIKLVELFKPFINKNKYVLDPFLGSGTTLKWCKQNKFNGIGYEINEAYYKLSKNYIKND